MDAAESWQQQPKLKGKFVSRKYRPRINNLRENAARKSSDSDLCKESGESQPSINNTEDGLAELKTLPVEFPVDGRRIIHVSHLASQMYCEACSGVLELKNIRKEVRYGLASIFDIQCSRPSCQHISKLTTDTVHTVPSLVPASDKHITRRPFDVNTKAAVGKSVIVMDGPEF